MKFLLKTIALCLAIAATAQTVVEYSNKTVDSSDSKEMRESPSTRDPGI